MQTYTDSQIKDAYTKLPRLVQEFIESPEFKDVMLGISNLLNLHADKAGVLYDETLLVLLNLAPAQEFVKRVEKGLEIDEKEAAQVAEAVNEHVFTKIREEVLGAPEQEDDVETKEKKPQSTGVEAPRYGSSDPYREPIE